MEFYLKLKEDNIKLKVPNVLNTGYFSTILKFKDNTGFNKKLYENIGKKLGNAFIDKDSTEVKIDALVVDGSIMIDDFFKFMTEHCKIFFTTKHELNQEIKTKCKPVFNEDGSVEISSVYRDLFQTLYDCCSMDEYSILDDDNISIVENKESALCKINDIPVVFLVDYQLNKYSKTITYSVVISYNGEEDTYDVVRKSYMNETLDRIIKDYFDEKYSDMCDYIYLE